MPVEATLTNVITAWDILSRVADVIGVISFGVGTGSLIISVVTWKNTRNIKKAMINHVEKSEFLDQIETQIDELNVYRSLLIEQKKEELNDALFLRIETSLADIRVAYKGLLDKELINKIENLREYIKTNLYGKEYPYKKHVLERCVTVLSEVVGELKKERKII